MEDLKKLFIYFRNAVAFSYSWLVFCYAFTGYVLFGSGVACEFLLKLLVLCAWGSAVFVFAFCTKLIKKKGFIFSLTLFFLLFIPVEILMFYWMNVFSGTGTVMLWTVLGIIVAVFYAVSVLIDVFVMRRRAKEYTAKLEEYRTNTLTNP